VALVGVFHTEALQRPEVVPVTQFLEEVLLDRPEAVATLRAEVAFDVPLEIVLDTVVIQQRVIHIHQEDERAR
jgi:hypothetical protein